MKINYIMSILTILTGLYVIRQSVKIKNIFVDIVYSVLVVKNVLEEHKEVCLEINYEQTVKLGSDLIKFKNYSKQLDVPFKI